MSVHYKTITADLSNATFMSRIYAVALTGDSDPGTNGVNLKLTINGSDVLMDGVPPTWDSAAAGSGGVNWYYTNLASPSAGIPVSQADFDLTGACSVVIAYEPA
jgi:hypothetical protein